MELEIKTKQSNIKTEFTSRYREVLSKVLANPPNSISISEIDDKGDITFSFETNSIGLKDSDCRIYEKEFFSHFVIDFIGELIIRENLGNFVTKIDGYGVDEYSSVVNKYGSHEKFGIKVQKGMLTFKFHVSFLKEILSEGLRESLG